MEDYRRQNATLDGVVEYHSMNFTLLGGSEPQRVRTGVVSADFFDVLEVKPLLGRTFRPEEDGHGRGAGAGAEPSTTGSAGRAAIPESWAGASR